MSEILTLYFENHAERSISRMKEAILAVNFYKRIKLRLDNGEDLSSEIPVIAKIGVASTIKTVKEAIADYKKNLNDAWNIHPRLLDIGAFKCSLIADSREQLPRANLLYKFKSESGTVSVHITSAGENYKVEINAGKNPMAAKLACTELEKNLTFIALSS